MKSNFLFRNQSYLAGEWVNAASGKTYDVRNPATLEIIGTVPGLDTKEIERAIDAASDAFDSWKSLLPKERGVILKRWAGSMVEHRDDLAEIMVKECGKPFKEAQSEIDYAASFLDWYGEEARRGYGDIVPPPAKDKRFTVIKQPVGVVAAITPWNFPSSMITRKVGPALAAGCPVVLKPALETPFSALALAVLGEQAGLPKGVFSAVTGESKIIGAALTSSEKIKHLSFTGSTAVGKQLMGECSDSLKKLSFELGGHAPFIIFESADLDKAIEGLIASKFRNAGQTCVCANRIFVQDKIYDTLKSKLIEKVKTLKVGNGMDEGVQIGPLINEKGMEKVERHVKDAVEKGAKILLGGAPHELHKKLGGYFYQPTILDNVTDDMLITKEETFGPVIPLLKFSTEEEAIQRANATPYGLAGYFYSENVHQTWRVYEQMECGMIGINTGAISYAEVPFGGVKQSGMGREGGKYGMDEYLEIKYGAWGQ